MREKLGHQNPNWRLLSNLTLAMEQTGNWGGLEKGMENKGWWQQTPCVEISAPIEEVTLGGLQHDWGWVSDGVLETGQGEPFVPAAATFQSATVIYTPALIERLACEPSACTCTHTLLLFLSSSRSVTIADTAAEQLLTPRTERPDMLRLCFGKHPVTPNLHLWKKLFS